MRSLKRILRLGGILSAVLFGGALRASADPSAEATITVTPSAEVSLELDDSTVEFGAIDVNTSTDTATAITLTNTGEVSVKVRKEIIDQSDPNGWTAAETRGHDQYVLYCATAAARIPLDDYANATKFGAEAVQSFVTGASGTAHILDPIGPSSSVPLWFRLDMPSTVSSQQWRSILIRFTGVAE
jgi:hypothetical protein